MRFTYKTLVLVIIGLCSNGQAQVGFGGECSGAKNPLSASLQGTVKKQRIGAYEDCDLNDDMCGGSFAFDLNGDKSKEYFIRLGCGGTGNCLYGIFGDRPVRLIGKFIAWYFWIEKSNAVWPKVITYEREGGDQGYISTYVFRRGKYRRSSGRAEKFSSAEKSFLEKMGTPECKDIK